MMANTATNSALPPRNLSPGSQLATLFGTQFKLLLLARKTRALLAIQLVPVLAAFVYVIFESVDGLTMFSGITESVTIPFLVPLAAIFFGGPAIVDEMEGRTLTYLTLRPVGKGTLFVGKALAGIAMALPIVLLPMILLFGICLWQSSDWGMALESLWPTLGAVAVGTTAYTAVFAALGAAFASGLLASIIYFVIFEMVFGVLPILELLSVRYHIRTTAGMNATDRLGILDQLVMDQPLVLEWYWGMAILVVLTAAGLGIGAWIFRERQYYV
jgi:ABC-type transport system involved in multi-copper enzyme maturation permease subunit